MKSTRDQDEYFKKLMRKHLPEYAVNYCFQLWKTYPFNFKVTQSRQTKLGDYKFNPSDKQHSITVNGDLNRYHFLITYIHEVAHLVAYLEHSRKIKPHGTQWKKTFRKLMQPLITRDCFPPRIYKAVYHHMKSPKASSSADPNLYIALREWDQMQGENLQTMLDEIELNHKFSFKGQVYIKGEKRRTRVLCKNIANEKWYLIPKTAPVTHIQDQESI